ncbi:MAG: hypothetical protein QOF14_5623 [Hyphomicrobiales bacterium]|jgi:hypothetical protein|nr:hypothetical protein [Hyphomicrobiales bacterium]
MNGISPSYVLMMMAAGATIGAVAGLSNTSVSNTLIQLVLTFVSGSAGLYYIKRDTLRKEATATHAIGLIGILFLASFWISYIPTSCYRYKGEAFYAWKKNLSFEQNVALAEIHGHAQKLGMSVNDFSASLTAGLSKGGTCALLTEDPVLVSSDIERVYGELSKQLTVSDRARSASDYIQKQFRYIKAELQERDADRKSAAKAQFESAILALVALGRDQGEIRSPFSAPGATPAPQLARDVGEKIQTCEKSPLLNTLVTIRGHARAYEAIWKQPVSTKPSKSVGTLESLN